MSALTAAILLVIFILYSVFCYNGIVAKREAAESAWAQVESTFQRRSDLISNLVNLTSVYIAHQKTTHTEVTSERLAQQQEIKKMIEELQQLHSAGKGAAVSGQKRGLTGESMQRFAKEQAKIGAVTGKLLAAIEAYPDLRASDQLIALQAQLRGTRNRINRARINFNQKVKAFNSSIRIYPGRFFAAILGLQSKPYFEREDQQDKVTGDINAAAALND